MSMTSFLFSQITRHAFIFLVFLFPTTILHAGNGNTAMIDSLNAEAAKQYKVSFSRSVVLASKAKELSEEQSYQRGYVEAKCIIEKVQAYTNFCTPALAELSAEIAKAKEYEPELQGILYSAKGMCWFAHGNYDSAKKYHEKALPLFSARSLPYAHECLLLSKAYLKTNNKELALEHYEQAAKIFNEQRDKEGIAYAQDLLGEIFYAQRLYDKALVSYTESLNIFRALQHRPGIGAALTHKGNVYFMQVKDDSAKACYQEALNSFLALGDKNGMAICYSNTSRILLEAGNTTEAIAYANKALATIAPGNYIAIEAGTYQHIGDIYGELKQYDKATSYVHKALATARKSDNKIIIQSCYKSLSELYEVMKQPQLALENLRAAYRIKDSVLPATFTSQLAEMETRYKTEKKEAEIRILKQEQQINTLKLREQQSTVQRQRYLLAMLALAIVTGLIALYQYMARRKQMEQVRRQQTIRDTEEKERVRIAKDIHDELGSGLSKIKFLSELANTQTEDQQRLFGSLHSIADTSKGLVENMRDLVWAMNPENTTLSHLVARIREYAHDYLEEFPVDLVVDIPEDVPDIRIPREMNRNVYMIVKEALQNIVKHSFATRVFIRVALYPKFRLEIQDNGKGYEPHIDHEGNGLKNMASRTQALGAVLHTTSAPEGGSTIILEFALERV